MTQQLYNVSVPPAAAAAAFGSGAPSASSTTGSVDEGLALFITFGILVVLSTQDATAKWALWIGVALLAITWTSAVRSGAAKTFWQTLAP